MADGTQPILAPLSDELGGALVFALAGRLYAVPIDAVEAIAPPPTLCRIPHAPPPLIGAGNLGGQILPIIDFGRIVPGRRSRRRYDGGGEVLRLRAAGGSVGLWIDWVERIVEPGQSDVEAVTAVDPERLVAAGMAAPSLASEARNPLGDAQEIVERPAAAAENAYFLIETAGTRIRLPGAAVTEFVATLPWVTLPGAPAGFCGVGILRGEAIPILSLAALLDLPQTGALASFAVTALAGGHRLLLGFDRVIGSHTPGRHRIEDQAEDVRDFDPATAVTGELRRIVTDFASAPVAPRQTDPLDRSGSSAYLAFVAGGQNYALPAHAVDRVVPPQPMVALPDLPGRADTAIAIAGAIELRGQVVPVLNVETGVGGAEPGAYVILRADAGSVAVAADRVDRLVALRPDQITAAPDGAELIDGVAVIDGGGIDGTVLAGGDDFLRILAPERLGRAS